MGAGYILMFLAEAVACGNQTYFHKGLKTQYEDLKQLKDQPAEFTRLYHDVIIENDIHQIKDKCKQIIKSTIDFLGLNSEIVLPQTVQASCAEEKAQADETAAVNYANAAGWYEELSSTFNKIYICAENKNYMLAFLSACCLQYSLKSDLEIPLKTKDLLSEFQYDDLERLASRAREIEWNCISEIEKNHVTIKRVESVEILLQYKSQANKHI